MTMEDFMQVYVAPTAIDAFVMARVTCEEMAVAMTTTLAAAVDTAVARAKSSRVGSVLELRDVAEAIWRDLALTEPHVLVGALDSRKLVEHLRTAAARDDVSGRLRALSMFLHDATAATVHGSLKDVRRVSFTTKVQAAVNLVRTWERTTLRGSCTPTRAEPVCAVAAVTGGGPARRSVLGASKATMENVAAAMMAGYTRHEQLTVESLRAYQKTLQTASITAVLSFGYHAIVDDWEGMFLAMPTHVLLGVPAMLREARPWRPAHGVNPATIIPKAEGGAVPPPTQFLYTVGKGRDGHVGLGGTALLQGGGLLCVLPGWHGTTKDGVHYAHYWRVDTARQVATIIEVYEAEAGDMQARVKLTFQLDMPEPDDDGAEDRAIDWIDAQRDFEGTLVLAWGGYNPLTGGVAWTCYMGVAEKEAYVNGDDPFYPVNDADVDNMFFARLESAEAIDLRDCGSVVSAQVKYVEEVRHDTRLLSPVTTVIYHQTVLNELGGVEAAAIWGTPSQYVVWTKDGHAATVQGATAEDEHKNFQFMNMSRSNVPAIGNEADIVSIAPWWWPLL